MDQVGKIENIHGNKATISVKRVSACGDNCKGCSSSCDQPVVYFDTEITDDYEIGEFVEITTENDVMLKQIAMIYGIPLVVMLVTIGIVQLVLFNNPNKDIISAVASVASLVIAYFILKAYDRKEMKNNTLKFTVGRKL